MGYYYTSHKIVTVVLSAIDMVMFIWCYSTETQTLTDTVPVAHHLL